MNWHRGSYELDEPFLEWNWKTPRFVMNSDRWIIIQFRINHIKITVNACCHGLWISKQEHTRVIKLIGSSLHVISKLLWNDRWSLQTSIVFSKKYRQERIILIIVISIHQPHKAAKMKSCYCRPVCLLWEDESHGISITL